MVTRKKSAPSSRGEVMQIYRHKDFQKEQTMEIKPNTYYRTRDGRKAFVAGKFPEAFAADFPFIGRVEPFKESDGFVEEVWKESGATLADDKKHPLDLIAEWKEPAEYNVYIFETHYSIVKDAEFQTERAGSRMRCAIRLREMDGVVEIVEQVNHVGR